MDIATWMPPALPTVERPQHEVLIDEFLVIDKECQELIEKFNTGKILYDSMPTEGGASLQEFMMRMVEKFVSIKEYLNQLIEKRNAKLQEAAAAMRGIVMASESVVRGVDGKASTAKYGPFDVSSKTSRSFDTSVLFEELKKLGLYERLFELTVINDKTGAQDPAVKQEWAVDYQAVKNWLREQNLEAVLDAAYEEQEGTPAVTGPKPLAMLGEVDKSKKGKK